MFLPFKQEAANYNFNDFDIFTDDKFIGMIKPDGELFKCSLQHSFGPAIWSLRHFFKCSLKMETKEECLSYVERLRGDHLRYLKNHKDVNFVIPLMDWQINYTKKHFDLDSQFMKKYIMICQDSKGDSYSETASDYIVQLAGFAKVEQLQKTITTARVDIYEPFFNYLLMDFQVKRIPTVVYNEELGDFCYYRPNEFIVNGRERELQEEIQLIKKYIPLSERHNYFR